MAATVAPAVVKRSPRTAARARTTTLDDVRRALRARRSPARARGKGDAIIAFLLFAGLLTFLQLGVLSATGEYAVLRTLRRPTVRLVVAEAAEVSQIHALLQTLLRLPQVEGAQYMTREQQFDRARSRFPEETASLSGAENPFPDAVDVTFRSPDGFGALAAFLRQSRLRFILHPRFLWEMPDARAALQSELHASRLAMLLSVLAVVTSLTLLILAIAQFVRGRLRLHEREMGTLRLLGADARSLYFPCVSETVLLLVAAIVFSLILVFLFHGAFPNL